MIEIFADDPVENSMRSGRIRLYMKNPCIDFFFENYLLKITF